MTPAQALAHGLGELALPMPAEAQEKLLAYVGLLAKWNRVHNLTAIRDPLEMVTHHVLDSLSVVSHLPLGTQATLADIGSGGGLPGIPLAIARPAWNVTLNDSLEKKAAFLRQAKIELGLTNVAIHEGRAEAWRPAARFQLVISRAFAELRDFLAVCAHLVDRGGWLAAMKGTRPAEPGACDVIRLRVPMLDAERHLVLCRGG
jgi:16S rRNA (guanine527-N7)-methyltransferase